MTTTIGSIVLLAFGTFRHAVGHAIMTSPVPRGGVPASPGTKLLGFALAPGVVNDNTDGCGGPANGVQSTQGTPTATYSPGEQIVVRWSVTIPHDDDRVNTGVRVAIRYSDTDGFSQNILAGGVTGDPPFTPVSSGSTNAEQTLVTLPAGKTCNPCTLQWVQAAQNDNGYYLNCADIVITNDAPPTTGGGATTGGLPGQQPQVPGYGSQPYQPTSGGVYGQIAGASSLCPQTALMALLIGLAMLLVQQ